ncbi:MAG: HAD hydrolase-like protein [Planctomycetota bacterium]
MQSQSWLCVLLKVSKPVPQESPPVRLIAVSRPLCLFDIDGTLLPQNIEKIDLRAVVSEVAGRTAPPAAAKSMSGRTDRAIVTDLLVGAGIERGCDFEGLVERALAKVDAATSEFLRSRELPTLPGVVALLERLRALRVLCGLLTGNTARRATVKMRAARLAEFFPFGAYGDASVQRADLVDVALSAASAWLGAEVERRSTVIIGDSPGDLHAARAGALSCVLVATGYHSREELAELEPDLLLDDLAETDPVMAHLRRLWDARP